MSNFNYGDRLVLLEQKYDLLHKEITKHLNEFASAISGIVGIHRAFQAFVDTKLKEIRKHVGLSDSDSDPDQQKADSGAETAEQRDDETETTENQGITGEDQSTNGRTKGD